MNQKIVEIDVNILGGTPVFYGTRVPIKNLFDYIESGETIDLFLSDFESVNKEQVMRLLLLSKNLISATTNLYNENIA
jgi:uncharacterized protein (DUF433 family)